MGASDLYEKYKKVKDAREYYKLIKEGVDKDTRSGAALKLGVKVAAKVLDKVLNAKVSSHPYFTYHKVHIEVLARAINVSSAVESARESLSAAINAADSSLKISSQYGGLTTQTRLQCAAYAMLLHDSLEILAMKPESAARAAALREINFTETGLLQAITPAVISWRNEWAKLTDDALSLLAMVQFEVRIAEIAVAEFEKKLASLESRKSGIGGALGAIGAYRLREDKMWEQLDRMTNPSATKTQQAADDPARFARQQLAKVDATALAIITGCNAAMSDDVFEFPGRTRIALENCAAALQAAEKL